MRNGRTVLVVFVCLSAFIFGASLIQFKNRSNPVFNDRQELNVNNQNSYNDENTCIVFLKAHKCASTTVQNIIMRYGYSRGLDFVLPAIGNYIGNPKPFDATLIPFALISPTRKYDIFTHHTRYNYTAMRSIMKPDCKFVTILRDPATLYESLFNFYHLDKYTNVTFKELIESKRKWPRLKLRMLNKIGLNQMSWDLGYTDGKNVDKFILKLNKEFDLIMISEYMDASLVLLAELMKWPLEYVRSLKLNSRQIERTNKLSEDERDVLMELNSVDAELYDYFSEKFRLSLLKYGKKKLMSNVIKLLKLNTNLRTDCVEKLNNKGYAKTTNYDLRNTLNWTCVYAAKTELSFTEEIRNEQIERFKTIKKLELLLVDSEDN